MTTTTQAPADAAPARPGLAGRYGRRLNEIGLLAAIVLLYIVLGASASGFLSLDNQLGLLRNAATIGIAAWGVTLVSVSGDSDISSGPAVASASAPVAQGSTDGNLRSS